jgi:excisionase family DNA binding protein
MRAANGRPAAPMILNVPPEVAVHIAAALILYRRQPTTGATELPKSLAQVEEYMTERATQCHARTLLDELQRVRNGCSVPPEVVTYQAAASLLAVSVRTVQRLVAAGTLKSIGVRGARRIRVAEVAAYLDSPPGA